MLHSNNAEIKPFHIECSECKDDLLFLPPHRFLYLDDLQLSMSLGLQHTLASDLFHSRVLICSDYLWSSFQLSNKLSKLSTGRPSSSMPSSRRCPCVGGKSSCVCSRWRISRWSGWSWRLVWVWAPWRSSTRCWGCGVSAPLAAWMMSSRPCTTWIYLAVPSYCRNTWTSCSGNLNWSHVSQSAEVTKTMVLMGHCRTREASAPGNTRTIRGNCAS